MLPIRIVLHPTDFSDCSRHAFEVACSLARDYGARLVLLYVAEPPTLNGDGAVIVPTLLDIEPFRDLLEQLKPDDPKIPVARRVLEGDPAREILAVAEETKCDLIVMGTHGRTGLGRLLMGSVAEQIVRKASCPVLTLRSPLRKGPTPEEPHTAAINRAVEAHN